MELRSKLEDVKTNELPFIKNKILTLVALIIFLKISELYYKYVGRNFTYYSNLILKNSSSADKNFKKYIIKKFKKEIRSSKN